MCYFRLLDTRHWSLQPKQTAEWLCSYKIMSFILYKVYSMDR